SFLSIPRKRTVRNFYVEFFKNSLQLSFTAYLHSFKIVVTTSSMVKLVVSTTGASSACTSGDVFRFMSFSSRSLISFFNVSIVVAYPFAYFLRSVVQHAHLQKQARISLPPRLVIHEFQCRAHPSPRFYSLQFLVVFSPFPHEPKHVEQLLIHYSTHHLYVLIE